MSASAGYPPFAVPVTVLSSRSTKFDMKLKHAAEPTPSQSLKFQYTVHPCLPQLQGVLVLLHTLVSPGSLHYTPL